MGLPAALRAHQQEDFELAAKHYQRALNHGSKEAILFQNYGSLLRSHNSNDLAKKVLEKGFFLHPKHQGIRQNLANLYQITDPWRAFELHLANLHDSWPDDLRSKHFLSVVSILESEGYILWAYQLCKFAFTCVTAQPSLLIIFYRISTHENNSVLNIHEREALVSMIDDQLETFSSLDKAEYYYALSWVNLQRGDLDPARKYFDNAQNILRGSSLSSLEEFEQAQNLNNQNSWNMACVLLSYQQLEAGWKYFEYGLRTKAPGSQKWQRALPKPFTHHEIGLWRGEVLLTKRLLLLEEQAIGDVMQFLTLIPTLLEEASHIGLLINSRLIPIYQRSFDSYIQQNRISIWSFDDVKHRRLQASDFDYQSPLGSICRYRFNDISMYGKSSPLLLAHNTVVEELKDKYNSLSNEPKKIVGISWRGGGTGERIKQKSLEINAFARFLDIPGIRFISLQYGESASVIETWKKQGLDVFHDDTVDSLKDMDRWLAQVAACDGVLSVANTTIHGAGGLNIPTLCLLSTQSDWRWLKDESVLRSYWYPSVGILRESASTSWSQSHTFVHRWLEDGVPYPQGPVCV